MASFDEQVSARLREQIAERIRTTRQALDEIERFLPGAIAEPAGESGALCSNFERLTLSTSLAASSRDLREGYIAVLRAEGRTWQEIADLDGLASRQAAFERYSAATAAWLIAAGNVGPERGTDEMKATAVDS